MIAEPEPLFSRWVGPSALEKGIEASLATEGEAPRDSGNSAGVGSWPAWVAGTPSLGAIKRTHVLSRKPGVNGVAHCPPKVRARRVSLPPHPIPPMTMIANWLVYATIYAPESGSKQKFTWFYYVRKLSWSSELAWLLRTHLPSWRLASPLARRRQRLPSLHPQTAAALLAGLQKSVKKTWEGPSV